MIPELYKDYGSVCYAICVALNRKNNSTISQICKNTSNSDISLIYQGLAILMQRNIVSYYKLNSKYFYKYTPNRRLYYNLYLSYIRSVYDINNYKHFFTVLMSGTYKLINTDLDIYKDDFIISVPLTKSIKRSKSNIYMVNYEKLDKALLDMYMVKYINQRYSKSMCEIYKSVCKCITITHQDVLNNLESNSIFIKDNISYINDVSNIDEYLKYLINFGVIKKDIESDRYARGNIREILRMKEICKIFKNDIRLINLFKSNNLIKDSDIGKLCLMKDFKEKLFRLLKYKILNTESGDTWKFNKKWNIKMAQVLEDEVGLRANKINKLYSEGSVVDNEEFMVYVNECTYLASLYFLFN